MGHFTFGVILGLAIGIIEVLLMLPLAFPDKPAAPVGAFSSRFALVSSLRSSRFRCHPSHPGSSAAFSRASQTDRDKGLRANSHYRYGVRRGRGMGGRPLGSAVLALVATASSLIEWASCPQSR